MDVNEKILDAIELLANNSVQKAGYDKTIQAQILSCEDQVAGKYRCKYQDAIFYAYTNNPDIKLSKGTLVYILVPSNDMRQQKTIIGTVSKLGVDYVSAAVGDQAYSIVGSNVIHGNDKFYLDVDIADYSFDIYNNIDQNDINLINLNRNQLSLYIKQSSSIIIGMSVKTNIPLEKQKIGSYGIKFSLEFRDSKNNMGIIRDYILDENKMIDNPYNLIYPTRQYAIFDNIDGQHFIAVRKITIFNKNFPGSEGEDHTTRLLFGQIELFNFELSCAVRMSQEELNGLGLSIISPRGLLFLNQTDEPKILQAQVKFKGRVVPADSVSFYWGIEDLQITPQRKEYNKYLGRGWKCLNKSNIIQLQGDESPTVQWVSYGDTYSFPFSQALTRKSRIKVAAIYENNAITKQITIQNQNYYAENIVIESTNGTEFYYGIGETQLKCSAFLHSSYTQLVYAWGKQNNGGQLQQFSYTTNTIPVEAKYIYNFAIYKCSVYDRYEDEGQLKDHLIGTASIKLSNAMQSEALNLLTIENGSALYKYNEKGISPTSKTLQNPQIIQQLKFKLYDNTGEEISIFYNNGLMNPSATVKWRVPATNTLLILSDPPQTIIDNYYIIQNVSSLTYDIADRYDPRKTINQIILQVTYDGSTSFAQTNLTFTKQGQIGTNGTDYYVNIIPNVPDGGDIPPLFPMITKFNNINKCKLNYKIQSEGISSNEITEGTAYQLLKVQFLHGGEQVTLGQNDSIKWRVLKNHYYGSGQNKIEDASDFSIPDNDNSKLIYNHSLTAINSQVSANIIECQITYDGHTYYSAIPFITAYMTSEESAFDLVDGTGFHYVMYSSEGMQPEYSSLPFEFTDGNHGTCQVLGNIRTYDSVNRNWNIYQNSGDLVQDNQDQFKIQPIGFYKGECVNNSVRYTVTNENNNLVGIINIPIHFYLNRYNFAHLNGWDGNSIQINEKDGYILAPQLGAGKKQDNNSFTGVLMGEVKNPMKNQSDVGLFGYANGERSFFVNSKYGSAIFGTSGNGQIIIDPASDNAMLYSHSFWQNYNSETGLPTSYGSSNEAGAGMLIDLTSPRISFGNGNFTVDSSGNVTLTGNLQAGKINDGQNTYYNFEVNNSATGAADLLKAGHVSGSNNYNFVVKANGNVIMAGDITANSGHIGGSNGWTIGSESSIGYIFAGNRNTWAGNWNPSTGIVNTNAQGIYIGTNGISVGDGSKVTFAIDSQGNVSINGNITLGPNSSISWEALPNDVVAQGDLSQVAYSGDYNDLDNQPNIPVLPSYIKSTYIDQARIESPYMYAGQYFATGQGRNNGAAYYLYNGYTRPANPLKTQPYQGLGTEIGYISYDVNQNVPQGDNPQRVLFTTLNGTALKILSAGNMSLQAGTESAFQTDYRIYFRSLARLDCGFAVSSDYSYSSLDPAEFFSTERGWGYALILQPGQVYFKIVD